MAILRANEIHEMSIEEIEDNINELQRELSNKHYAEARGRGEEGQPPNTGKISEVRKTIARLKTIKNEKERG